MHGHGVEVSFVRTIRDVDQFPARLRVYRDLGIHFPRIRGSDNNVRAFQVALPIRFAENGDSAQVFCFVQLGGYDWRDDPDLRPGLSKRERFPCTDRSAAQDDSGHALTMERDREIAHRNCPRLRDAILNTT